MSRIATIYFIAGLLIAVIVVVLTVPQLRGFLTTTVAQEVTLSRTVRIEIPEDAPVGEHEFNINVTDSTDGKLLAQSEQVMILVEEKLDSGSGGDGGGGGGSGGGGGGEGASGPYKTYAFAPERGHDIAGNDSGVVNDGSKVVVKLAENTATLKKKVNVPLEDFWFYIVARHDKPTPVKLAIYLNGKAWKVVTLDKGNNSYELIRVGVLRNFRGGVIGFRLTNDVFDRGNPNNEELDRNAFIDAWALSTDPNLKQIAVGSGKVAAGRKVGSGKALLPHLNQITREMLGPQFVNWDIWSYYAARLVAAGNRPEAITTRDDLNTKITFWRYARPARPRGD